MQHELEEVFAWLEAGPAADYQAGVLLLQQHCRNRSLVNNLLKKESAANRDKLTYELVKVGCRGNMDAVSEVLTHFAQAVQGAVPPVADVLVEAPRQPVNSNDPEPEAAPTDVPEAVRGQVEELTQLLSKLHNQRCQLSNSLADLSDADAPAVVAQILDLQNQYNALAEKRRRVGGGEQPAPPADAAPAAEQPAPAAEAAPASAEQPAAPAIDRAALLQQRSNLRSNISKSKKKAEEAKTEAKRSEHQQKVAQWEVELQQVDMQLALPREA